MKAFLAIVVIAINTASVFAESMQMNLPVEECHTDTNLAVVIPERHELFCKFGPGDPWGFSFAGFETKWNAPLELEVSGSGGYEVHDVFSIAALAIDYGRKDGGWSERHLFSLGLMQGNRPGH